VVLYRTMTATARLLRVREVYAEPQELVAAHAPWLRIRYAF
jgi:hypothetical protein